MSSSIPCSDSKRPLASDLLGFWEMVQIQVEDVNTSFSKWVLMTEWNEGMNLWMVQIQVEDILLKVGAWECKCHKYGSRHHTVDSRCNIFLVACTWFYMSLCQSVIRPSVITLPFQAFGAEKRTDLSYCPCPTTIMPLPTRTRLMLSCIQPCSIEKNLIEKFDRSLIEVW